MFIVFMRRSMYISCAMFGCLEYFRALTSVVEQSETDRDQLLSSLSQHCRNSHEALEKFSRNVEDTNRDFKKFGFQVSDFCTKTQDVSTSAFFIQFEITYFDAVSSSQ
jgi:hypothetical protein